jgi:hypothetical protein
LGHWVAIVSTKSLILQGFLDRRVNIGLELLSIYLLLLLHICRVASDSPSDAKIRTMSIQSIRTQLLDQLKNGVIAGCQSGKPAKYRLVSSRPCKSSRCCSRQLIQAFLHFRRTFPCQGGTSRLQVARPIFLEKGSPVTRKASPISNPR